MLESAYIKKIASEVGFDLCGIASSRNFDAERERFEQWLSKGYGGGLEYLNRNVSKRFSPEEIMPGTKTVVVCAVSYKNDTSIDHAGQCTPKIASYARSRDYHYDIKEMLAEMAAALCGEYGTVGWRMFTDSAPVAEKSWAVEAGLGWIGRNSLVVTPQFGSFILLGELFIDAPADEYDSRFAGVGCGNCTRCVDACPNNAITPDGIDTRRCISRLTIEKNDGSDVRAPLHGWVFGCDECQAVCPHNGVSPMFRNPRFVPSFDPRQITAGDWMRMQPDEFAARFGQTPLSRPGLTAIQENIRGK